MNRKQVIFLLLALVVVGSAGLILIQRNRASWSVQAAKTGDKVLPNFQPNAVESIHIKSASELNLVHSNGVWIVQERGYPANFHQISDMLLKLRDLKVVEAETAEPDDLARVNLEPPGTGASDGTLVEFKDASGRVFDSLLLGKKHTMESSSPLRNGTADGRYVLRPSDPHDVFLVAEPLAALEPNPQQWLDKDFLKLNKIKSISLVPASGAESWKISRESESSPWQLLDARPGEALNTNLVAVMTGALSAPKFIDIAGREDALTDVFQKPATIMVESFDHSTHVLKIGFGAPKGNYYIMVEPAENPAGHWVYIVGSWIMNPLLRTRAQLLQGYQEAAPVTPAAANAVSNGAPSGWTPHVIQ